MVLFPNITDNISRPYNMIQFVNSSTDGMFGNLVLLAIFVIVFIALKDYKSSVAFAAAAFITTVLAFLFRTIGVIGDTVMIVAIIATTLSVVFLTFGERWK